MKKNEPKINNRPGGKPGNKNAEKWTEKNACEIANDLVGWLSPEIKNINGNLTDVHAGNIFFEKFLQSKGLYRDLTAYLCGKYKSFFDLIKKAKEIQELKIQEQIVFGSANVAAGIFLLKNHHGYKDRVEHTGNMQSGINFQLIPRKSKKKK